MTVPTLPTPPNRSQDQATFDTNISAWIASLDAWTTAVNAMGITTITGSIVNTPISGSTGAFTTLSASGLLKRTSTTGTTEDLLVMETAWNSPSGNKNIVWKDGTGVMGRISVDYTTPNSTMSFGSLYNSGYNATDLMTLSSTGLAVTGAISATTTIKTGGYTVGTLPAGVTGDRAYVTDATTPTYLGALTGGGAVVCPVFKNASAWISA